MKNNLRWDQRADDVFKNLMEKTPVFIRGMAQEKILKKIQSLVEQDHRLEITEKDVVVAFFEETPFGFHGPMKSDMEKMDVDYTQYGFKK